MYNPLVRLYDAETGITLEQITSEQLRWLRAHLVPESSGDRDYYIDRGVVAWLQEQGCEEALLVLLERVLEGREGLEVGWDDDQDVGRVRGGPFR